MDKVTLKTASFGALSNAETIRKDKGRGKGRGKGSRPGGPAVRSTNAEDYIFCKVEMQQVRCHFGRQNNIEGNHKCQSCFKWLIAWSDGRIATEACRMEITAKKTNKVFSLDKIDFEKQPRAQRVTDRTRADQRRAGRSNGNLKERRANSCWQIWEAWFQVDSGLHGKRPLLPLQQRGGADHAGLLPISRGSGKVHFS